MSTGVGRSLARLRSDRSRCKQPQDFIQAISTYIKLQILAVWWQLHPPHHFCITFASLQHHCLTLLRSSSSICIFQAAVQLGPQWCLATIGSMNGSCGWGILWWVMLSWLTWCSHALSLATWVLSMTAQWHLSGDQSVHGDHGSQWNTYNTITPSKNCVQCLAHANHSLTLTVRHFHWQLGSQVWLPSDTQQPKHAWWSWFSHYQRHCSISNQMQSCCWKAHMQIIAWHWLFIEVCQINSNEVHHIPQIINQLEFSSGTAYRLSCTLSTMPSLTQKPWWRRCFGSIFSRAWTLCSHAPIITTIETVYRIVHLYCVGSGMGIR